MSFTITTKVIEEMVAHARRYAPLEACGYLGGKDDAITVALPLTNADAAEEHFSFIPREQFEAVRTLRSKGLLPLGIYHSHPVTPARPSEEDIRLGNDPQLHYVIVSLKDDEPVVKSFTINNGVATVETFELCAPDGVHPEKGGPNGTE